MSIARRSRVIRKSFRDQQTQVNSWNRGLEAAFGDIREAKGLAAPVLPTIKPKRTYTKRIDAGPTEAQVLKSVLAYLRRHPLVASVERSQSGVFQEGNRIIRVGFVGKLDISGFLKGGRVFEIEVKRPGGKPTDAQKKRIDAVLSSGGISGYVTSIEETAALIK